MNNLRNAVVMVALVMMLVGMTGVAPAAPIAMANPQVVSTSSLPDSVLKDWVTYLDEARPSRVLDSELLSYKQTGIVPLDVAVNSLGEPSVLIAVAKGADMEGLKSIVKVNWMLDFKVATVVCAHVGWANLDKLENFRGVAGVLSDRLYVPRSNGFESRPSVEIPVADQPAMYENKKLIGADNVVTTYGLTGNGQVVGVCDTGVDFSQPDLNGAMYYDPSTGYPASFDPSGYGIGWTMYRFNTTNVLNVTGYLGASKWNRLSIMNHTSGKIYIPGTWNPEVNNLGSSRLLDDFVSLYLTSWYDDNYPNQTALTDFYKSVIKQKIELPPASAASGKTYSYTWNSTSGAKQSMPIYFAGWIFQQRHGSEPTNYLKVFAPALVLNNTKLVIDWETANAYTQFWDLSLRWEFLDFGYASDRNYIAGLGDWNFTNNLANDEWYTPDASLGMNHVIVAHDYNSDGINDFGLGALATGYDSYFGTDLVYGVGNPYVGGRLVSLIYDTDSHGTFVSGQIAGRGTLEYPVGLNGTLHKLYGVANQSKVIGLMAIGTGSHLGANIWEAGFDLNTDTYYFEYNPTSGHQAVVSSNSWGWVAPEYIELQPLYSLMYAALSTPGYFGVGYPGMLYCFSAGNSGPGFATIGAPCASQILSVGASTSYHTFDNSYGPNQGYDQIADFSSRGPLATGYPKPDVVAPGRNTFGIVPGDDNFILAALASYGYAFPLYATYAGTSMACPMVAGTVALMAEASLGTLDPDEYKTIIQSSAKDLGLDGMSQGFGRLDAKAAIDFVKESGTGVQWFNYGSTINYGATVAEAWAYYMHPYEGDVFVNDTAMPTEFGDASLYYGVVTPGQMASITMTGTYADTTSVQTSDFAWASDSYVVDKVWRSVWETYIYNETTSTGSNSIKAGWFNLQTELGSDYTDFANAQYATILLGGPTGLNAKLWAFVFDWSDTSPANGIPDYYNRISGLGDELTRIQYGGDEHTVKMDLSNVNGIGNLFPNTPIVAVHDESIWNWTTYNAGGNVGNKLNVTIITWKLVNNFELAVGDNVAGGLWVNLTVPNDAEPGVHQGYLVVGGTYKIPYTYFVRSEINTAKGEETLVASGYGNELNPMEYGANFLSQDSYYKDRSADHHSFIVHVSNSSAKYMGAKVEWADAATRMKVAIVSMAGEELANSANANKTYSGSASAIATLPKVPGDYIVYVTTIDLYYKILPNNFTLKVLCWTEVPMPTPTLSWHSLDHPAYTSITENGTATGDHIVLNATMTDALLTNMPDYRVTALRTDILKGLLFTATRTLGIPAGGFGESGTIDLTWFTWVYVPGIKNGDNVRLTVGFSSGDVDVVAYWAGTDNTTWSWSNGLTGTHMLTGANPEYYSFVAGQDGILAVGLFNYGKVASCQASVTVDTRAGPAKTTYGTTLEVSSYPLLTNSSATVKVTVDTGTNIKYTMQWNNVVFNNFFKPHLGAVLVSGSGAVKTITWSVSDLNAGDEHYYEVAFSADNGTSYQLLAKHLNTTSFVWNTTGFAYLVSGYSIRIIVHDNDPVYNTASLDTYWPGLSDTRVSASFTAGTYTPTTSVVGGGIDPVWIGLFGGIGVGLIVVLILFLVRKK